MTTTHSDLNCRKWTLIGLTVASAIAQIILMIIGAKFAEGQLKDMKKPGYSSLTDAQWEDAKREAQSIVSGAIVVGGVISLLIQLVGIIGAYKEHYCMTLTYAILMAFGTAGSIFSAIKSSVCWVGFIFNLIVCVLAFVLANDIKKSKRGMATIQWNAAQTVYQGQPNYQTQLNFTGQPISQVQPFAQSNYQTQPLPHVPVNFPGQPMMQLQAMSLDQPDYQQGYIISSAEQNFYPQPIQQPNYQGQSYSQGQPNYQGQPYPQPQPSYHGMPYPEAPPAYPTKF